MLVTPWQSSQPIYDHLARSSNLSSTSRSPAWRYRTCQLLSYSMAKISTSFPYPSHHSSQPRRKATKQTAASSSSGTHACMLSVPDPATPSIFCPVLPVVDRDRALSAVAPESFLNSNIRRHHRCCIRKDSLFDPTILFAGVWASEWCSELQVLVDPLDSDSRRSSLLSSPTWTSQKLV